MSVRNKRNPYFERRNHVALTKRAATKRALNFDVDAQTALWTLTLLPDGTLVTSGTTFTLNDTILEVA